MAAQSKLTRDDAQEWLESLQQVGEGWYRSVALAVRANAHKALGMERRDFARQIGQKMIDPRDAIIELYQAGSSIAEITTILGVDRSKTVIPVLKEAGVYREPQQLSGAAASAATAKSEKTAGAATGRGPSAAHRQAKADKKAALDRIPKAERKAQEAKFEEFVSDFKASFSQAAGVFLKPLAVELRVEMERVMDDDLEVVDYDDVVALVLETANELWVYGAKRGYDVSRIAEIIDRMRGGDTA